MYEAFLKEDLPSDVKAVIGSLGNASENHLSAFNNQVERGSNFRRSR
ncbi:hypothetical protein [Fusibacter sp. 3D3]|nr:hypothetical protein [Fusibacter sp. 3D3]GAU76812.1 hypothetical protein F3D3_1410 [Fusibacter sp. 3D3]